MTTNVQPRLLAIMNTQLDILGFKPPPSCKSQLEQMVLRGVGRMKTSKTLDQPGRVLQAEQALKELLTYFSKYARDAGTHPSINDRDFRTALVVMPPFWPFNS